jgi:superfamily II DNA or RNA helicase
LVRLVRQHFDSTDIVRYVAGRHKLAERNEMKVSLETGALKVLVATTVFDEGVNAPGIGALVLAGGGKAQHRLKQRLGRGMRLSEGKTELAVIDFYDTHSKLMWIHSEARKAAYKSDPAGYTVEVIS